mmetsp:Transcript_28059/g.56890  ORF Transcript_28059/g.56890 Transcript_28059/m.56890 type:complete len:141 (+) Transcript_28059:758-1180(+)
MYSKLMYTLRGINNLQQPPKQSSTACAIVGRSKYVLISYSPSHSHVFIPQSNALLSNNLSHRPSIRVRIVTLGPIGLHIVHVGLAAGLSVLGPPARSELMDPSRTLQQTILAGRLTRHPGMSQSLFGRISPSRINIQQLR